MCPLSVPVVLRLNAHDDGYQCGTSGSHVIDIASDFGRAVTSGVQLVFLVRRSSATMPVTGRRLNGF